jgi:phospholipid transport system substrate-binding protein
VVVDGNVERVVARLFSIQEAMPAAKPLIRARADEITPDERAGEAVKLFVVRKDPALKAGDLQKIGAVLDTKLKPYINFQRMTAAAVGPAWRQATPEQQKRLQEEFKLLLMRSYSGALSQIKDNSTIVVKPLRTPATEAEVVIRSELRGGNEPVAIDYRLEKTPDTASGWRIYNFNLLGVWLVDNYRTQFSQEINAKGIDGLIATLAERNKANNRK